MLPSDPCERVLEPFSSPTDLQSFGIDQDSYSLIQDVVTHLQSCLSSYSRRGRAGATTMLRPCSSSRARPRSIPPVDPTDWVVDHVPRRPIPASRACFCSSALLVLSKEYRRPPSCQLRPGPALLEVGGRTCPARVRGRTPPRCPAVEPARSARDLLISPDHSPRLR